jgi:hypothetical protein
VSYPGGKGVRRRRSRWRRRGHVLRIAALLAATSVVLFCAGWFGFQRHNSSSRILQVAERSANASESLALLAGESFRPAPPSGSKHPVYKFSVVPGGVRTARELREATLRDEQVAAHYAGFRFEKAKVSRLEKPVLVYISYRKNGQVLWTKKKHPLKAGEQVISDGQITGRTRCANRISVRKQLAVAPGPDPSPVELDQIEAPVLPPSELTFPVQYQSALVAPAAPASTPAGPGGSGGGLGPFPIIPGGGGGGGRGSGGGFPGPGGGGGGGGGTPPPPGGGGGGGGGCTPHKDCPPPPASVPEPGTILLVSSGLAAVAWWRKRRISQ